MTKYHIDQTDQKILSFLVKNARMPFLEIARECGVSGAAIHQRVRRLEMNGVITGSRLLVKPQAISLKERGYSLNSRFLPVNDSLTAAANLKAELPVTITLISLNFSATILSMLPTFPIF